MASNTAQTEHAERIKILESLLCDLKAVYETHLRDREVLDRKAWDILSFTSGLIGLITTLQIGLLGTGANQWFWVALLIVLIMYALLILEIRRVVKPRAWVYPPGQDKGQMTFGVIESRYIVDTSYEHYLVKLIIDYTGNDTTESGKGAIPRAEEINKDKAAHLQYAFRLMSLIMFGLVISSISALLL